LFAPSLSSLLLHSSALSVIFTPSFTLSFLLPLFIVALLHHSSTAPSQSTHPPHHCTSRQSHNAAAFLTEPQHRCTSRQNHPASYRRYKQLIYNDTQYKNGSLTVFI